MFTRGLRDVDHDLLATTSRARSIASTRIAISRRPGSSRVKFGVGLVPTPYNRPTKAPRFRGSSVGRVATTQLQLRIQQRCASAKSSDVLSHEMIGFTGPAPDEAIGRRADRRCQ